MTIRLSRLGTASAGPPLVAVPGIDGSIGSIAPIVHGLGQRRQVVVVDYRQEANPTLEGLSAEVADQVRSDVRGPVDMLGQSIGSIVAAQAAGLHGLPVRRMVLIGAFTRVRRTLRLFNGMMALTPDWLYRALSRPLMATACGPVRDGGHHPFFAASRDSNRRAVVKRTSWQVGRDFAPDLAAVPGRMLILLGARDRFVPSPRREVATLRRLFAGRPVQVAVVSDAGHVIIPSKAVATVVSRVDAFLSDPAVDGIGPAGEGSG